MRPQGSQILVAALVKMLAGTRGGHEFEPVGPLTLKGLSEPVEAWVVTWAPVVASSSTPLPLPAAFGAVEQFAFVGRDEPLEHLTAAVAQGVELRRARARGARRG